MPGTDGPGQFPDHNPSPAPSACPAARHLSPGPRPERGTTAANTIRGTFFLLLPHTPTHTVSESPNVP